jgi:hypothetical protein
VIIVIVVMMSTLTGTIHQACMHEYTFAPVPSDHRIITSNIRTVKDQDLKIALHPRWCRACQAERMRMIGDVEREQILAGSGEPFPWGEEEAFLAGLRNGRIAGIFLDPQFTFGQAELAVTNWSSSAPFAIYDLYCTFLGEVV